MTQTPLDILMSEFVPLSERQRLEADAAKVKDPPPATHLADLRTPIYGRDPNELLKHRFLYRGAIALLCGPTGIGKSSLLLQASMHWAVGRPFFCIEPGDVVRETGMRVLIVQAENDEGDLAEMRDGVLAGCEDLDDAEKAEAGRRILISTIADKSGEAFIAALDALLQERGPFDLAWIDPAFAYLGGDSNSQRDVSHFMRELLNPLVQRHKLACWLAHHTNKPLRGKEKEGWTAGDYAYLGAGSAEWINPARAALALRSVGSDTVFELRAAKRGRRLRWQDANGAHTNAQYIAHHTEPGVICWRQATETEIRETEDGNREGRPRAGRDIEAVHAVIANPGQPQKAYAEAIAAAVGCSTATAVRMLRACVDNGWLREAGDARFRRYVPTDQGVEEAESRATVHDFTLSKPF